MGIVLISHIAEYPLNISLYLFALSIMYKFSRIPHHCFLYLLENEGSGHG